MSLDTISVLEQSTGLTYRAAAAYTQDSTNPKTIRASASYVTGSHFAKFGVSERFGRNILVSNTNQEMTYRFLNTVPNQVTLFARPNVIVNNENADFGAQKQDFYRLMLSDTDRLTDTVEQVLRAGRAGDKKTGRTRFGHDPISCRCTRSGGELRPVGRI